MTAVVRAFVPLVAGILSMPYTRFYVANILSALVWAPVHVFPGVLLALTARALGGLGANHLALALMVGLILVATAWYVWRRWLRGRVAIPERSAFPSVVAGPEAGGDNGQSLETCAATEEIIAGARDQLERHGVNPGT